MTTVIDVWSIEPSSKGPPSLHRGSLHIFKLGLLSDALLAHSFLFQS